MRFLSNTIFHWSRLLNWLQLIVFLNLIAVSRFGFSAPMPAISTSQLLKELSGRWQSNSGFQISPNESSWKFIPNPKNFDGIDTVFEGSNSSGHQAALTIRTDALLENQNFNQYIKKSLRDYPRFGFEVLKSQTVEVNQAQAFLIDLYNRGSNKQLRQILIPNKVSRQIAILTCRDDASTFGNSLTECSKIIRTFTWIKADTKDPQS